MNTNLRKLGKCCLSVGLAVIMLLTSAIAAAPAAKAAPLQRLEASVASAEGTPGETVTVDVVITPGDREEEEAFWQYMLELYYDASVLELEGSPLDHASSGTFNVQTGINNNSGYIGVSAQNFKDTFIDKKQSVFSISFRIKDSAVPGTTSLSLDSGTFTYDTDPEQISVLNSGSISIVSKATAGITIGSVSAEQGATIDVPVTLTTASVGIGSYGLEVGFDSSVLEVQSVTGGGNETFGSLYFNEYGIVRAGWADASGGDHPAVAGQKLFTIRFKVKDDVKLDDYDLQANDVTATDLDGSEVEATLAGGKVSVRDKVPPVTENNSGNGSNTSTPSTSVNILVNGKEQNAGILTTAKRNDREVTTVAIDQKRLEERLAQEGRNAVITIPVNASSEIIVGELSGQMVENMKQQQAVLEFRTVKGSYTIPAEQLDIEGIIKALGNGILPQDIKISIEIAVPDSSELKLVEEAAINGGFEQSVTPIIFEIKAYSGDKSTEITEFTSYVARTIAIPNGADPSRITTAIVVDEDGKVRHVPTKVIQSGDTWHAVVNSVTNSLYALVWHPVEFADAAQHWSKNAVNDMGSRMIIEGTGEGRFEPDQTMTRAELAAVLVRGLGLKLESGSSNFVDVKEGDWYADAVQTAVAYGLVSGFTDGSFRPLENVTREQAMTIIARAMKLTGLSNRLTVSEHGLENYSDGAAVAVWAKRAIAECLQAGVVTGRSTATLAPQDSVTRAEAAIMVQKLLQASGLI